MEIRSVYVAFGVFAAALVSSYAETMEITPDIRLHGPDAAGLAYEARANYANGVSFLDLDTAEYAAERYHQSLLNSSSLTFLQEGEYYHQAETKVGLGEISIARYYDTLGGNPMYVTTVGQDISVYDGNVYAGGAVYAGAGIIANGGIQAGHVATDSLYAATVVTTPKWRVPDYVFEPNYKRTSLGELESFVREKRHLPDMPSAKEIESRGMDLAEMNLRLLKTVEELTLHVIDLDRTLKTQQAENSKLAEKVDALQNPKGRE